MPVRRGDHIGVNCTYTTTDATERTYVGLGTNDEMCLAETLFYPIDHSVPTRCLDADGFGYVAVCQLVLGLFDVILN